MYDFINAPVGKGLPIKETLRPLIASAYSKITSIVICLFRCIYSHLVLFLVPTTAGTGSETTGTAILDIPHLKFKTGIANRAMRPTLGIVDTEATETCPTEVHISAGLDVVRSHLLLY